MWAVGHRLDVPGLGVTKVHAMSSPLSYFGQLHQKNVNGFKQAVRWASCEKLVYYMEDQI